jgi:SEC-C motif-containing protein
MEYCPCGSEQPYESCCESIISGRQAAKTAEALLRSRYSAFVKNRIEYIVDTIHPEKRKSFDVRSIEKWAREAQWLRLEILDAEAGCEQDSEGKVEFIAHYIEDGKETEHHELAEFKKVDDRWYFFDGAAPSTAPFVRPAPKIGRNDPCPCGSGKKFKKCCGA